MNRVFILEHFTDLGLGDQSCIPRIFRWYTTPNRFSGSTAGARQLRILLRQLQC
jgi:hypothetical protein